MIAEAVAAMALFFPLFVLIICAGLEASYAYVIARNMSEGSYLAAQQMAAAYKSYPGIVRDSAAQQAVFSQIRIPNFVASNAQFYFPSNAWQTTGSLQTVTVGCKYISGAGSPTLPQSPISDPLGLGANFTVQSIAFCRCN